MINSIPFFIRKSVPFLMCLILILFSQTLNARFFCVPLVFIPIFYFALFRGRLLNVYIVFLLGLLADCIYQVPVGLFSSVFLLMLFVTRFSRSFLRELSAGGLWLFFGLLTVFLLLIQMFLFTVSEGSVVHTKFLFEQFIVTILLYPLFMVGCDRINNWIGDSP